MCSEHPTVDPWWVLALVEQLPMGSAYQASLADDATYRGWDVTNYLLADIFDAVQYGSYATVAVAGGKAKPPPSWPRPGSKAAKKQRDGGGQSMTDLFRQMRAVMAAEQATGSAQRPVE